MRAVIDLGGTSIRYSVLEEGELAFKPRNESTVRPEEQLESIARNLREDHDLTDVAVATTGTVSGDGIERMSLNGGEVEDVSPQVDGVGFYFENDTNAAALGESLYGAGENFEDVLYITLSTGISAGLVQNNNLVGSGGNFGKIGNYLVEDEKTWEDLCSGKAIPDIFNSYSDSEKSVSRAEEVFELAEKGDEVAETYLEDFLGRLNAKGVSNACVSYDPDVVVLGGSVAVENSRVRDDLLDYLSSFYPDRYNSPKIRMAELGHDSELYGLDEI